MCIIVCLNYIAKKKTTNNRVVVMGASLSTRGNKHRSNKNIDQPFKNGSQFHPTFDVHDVVSKNGGSTNETSQSIDDPAKFLLRASGVEIDDEKSVEDVHAEEVIKRHVVDDANFIGKPTTLNEDDMNAPLSHYFINSRYRNIFFLFLFIRLLSFFLSFVSNDDDDDDEKFFGLFGVVFVSLVGGAKLSIFADQKTLLSTRSFFLSLNVATTRTWKGTNSRAFRAGER